MIFFRYLELEKAKIMKGTEIIFIHKFCEKSDTAEKSSKAANRRILHSLTRRDRIWLTLAQDETEGYKSTTPRRSRWFS